MNPEDRIAEKLLNAAERVVRMSCFLFCLLLMMGGVWALYDTALLYYEASDQSVLRFRPQSSGETGNLYESLRGSVSWLVLDGAGGQRAYVAPTRQMVIVRMGHPSWTWEDSALPNLVTNYLDRL